MKFIISREELKSVMSPMHMICGQLNNEINEVKLTAEEKEVVIVAKNATTILEAHIPAGDNLTILEPGELYINGSYLWQISQKMEEGGIVFECSDDSNTLSIYNQKTKFQIVLSKNIAAHTFSLRKLNNTSRFETKADVFNKALGDVAYVVKLGISRPILEGVHLCGRGDDKIQLTATDQFRVARVSFQAENDCFIEHEAVLPKKTVNEIAKIFPEGDISVFYTSAFLEVKNHRFTYQDNMLYGKFPEIKSVFEAKYANTLVVNKDVLYHVLYRASHIKNDDINVINIVVNNDILTIKAEAEGVGRTEEKIPHLSFDYRGEKTSMFLNGAFLKDALRHLDTEDVLLSFNGGKAPLSVKNIDKENKEMVIMPLR